MYSYDTKEHNEQKEQRTNTHSRLDLIKQWKYNKTYFVSRSTLVRKKACKTFMARYKVREFIIVCSQGRRGWWGRGKIAD